MNIVLCENAEKRAFTAGNKARTDTVRILIASGYKHIPLFRSKSKKLIIILQMFVGVLRTYFLANRNDIVFIQYPYYPAMVNSILLFLLRFGRGIKHFKICILIHDSVGLRDTGSKSEVLRKEVELLNKADYVISHNEKMTEAFREVGAEGKYFTLGPFDYLYDGQLANVEYDREPTICVAGNLSKSKCGYLYEIDSIKHCKFNLYGLDYSGITNERIIYNGSFAPEELIEHLQGSFGLVWDGNSLEKCDGKFGNYLKFNNPHKFSLYIAAGLPIIIWDKAALSKYVKEMGIGICTSSLEELDTVLQKLTNNEYQRMVDNVRRYREDIAHGNNLKRILLEEIL